MEAIAFYSRVASKAQAAFIIFYSLESSPSCLMIDRTDNTLGFIGGMVESGESLEEAAIREASEEIGHMVTAHLEPLVAHNIGTITTHAFTAEVGATELETIHAQAETGIHYGVELNSATISSLSKSELIALLPRPMAPSVREELIHFLFKANIYKPSTLVQICEKAGYDLQELLR